MLFWKQKKKENDLRCRHCGATVKKGQLHRCAEMRRRGHTERTVSDTDSDFFLTMMLVESMGDSWRIEDDRTHREMPVTRIDRDEAFAHRSSADDFDGSTRRDPTPSSSWSDSSSSDSSSDSGGGDSGGGGD